MPVIMALVLWLGRYIDKKKYDYIRYEISNECTASAIIALLCPQIPATNLNTNKTKLANDPKSVTRIISFFLAFGASSIESH